MKIKGRIKLKVFNRYDVWDREIKNLKLIVSFKIPGSYFKKSLDIVLCKVYKYDNNYELKFAEEFEYWINNKTELIKEGETLIKKYFKQDEEIVLNMIKKFNKESIDIEVEI